MHRKITWTARSAADAAWLARTATTIVLWFAITPIFAQAPPVSHDRPWHTSEERQLATDARPLRTPAFRLEPDKVYSLAELIDLAETHNPETRAAWEYARAPRPPYWESLAASYFQP